MSYTIKIKGIEVTCETIEMLDALIERQPKRCRARWVPGLLQAIDSPEGRCVLLDGHDGEHKGENGVTFPGGDGCLAWKHPNRPSWDSGPMVENAKRCRLAPGHPGPHMTPGSPAIRGPNLADKQSYVHYARDVREKLDEPKPPDAEWTWEKALYEVEQCKVTRGVWRRRADEVTAQRERCDRKIDELSNQNSALNDELHAQIDAYKMPAGKLAEKIVYAITTSNVGADHTAGLPAGRSLARWADLTQMERAELVTTWIETVEAILKGDGK